MLGRKLHVGAAGYPTLGFNCTVNHSRRFLHIERAIAGSFNDKTKARRTLPLYVQHQCGLIDATGTELLVGFERTIHA